MLRNREDPTRHAARPIADVAPGGSQAGGEPLHRARQNPHAIGQQRTVRRIVDGRLDDGGVYAQAAPVNHPTLTRDRGQPLQQLREDRPVQHVGQTNQGLGVRHTLPVDPAEGPVHEAAPDFPLALVEAPIGEVFQDEHPEHDGGRGAEPPATSTQGVAGVSGPP